ncbi:MAG: hypothetical protein H6797_00635 [Candidatus Nomurabacteria bacterium]|nr:MAG: hypothetical protein H6797_00635 [Candidatus Nomurabacteria bacterium]
MNIYFCGIGGVGLGPLAEIALDAGYQVKGSDQAESLMSTHLHERGVMINYKQDGSFLREAHAIQPITWLVYSSGIPDSNPELMAARELGIKITKRDQLLSYIIKDKDLKLIAVAGTHGKTTTTAMAVWTFKHLNIPVSYSVGTTLSFGPSGHYEPGSQYFIYECDEFDRNFLHFRPYLSLITSLDYDHPDTYPTSESYRAAFQEFVVQSDFTILWQDDAKKLGQPQNTWALSDSNIANVTLAGKHNRQNASLVVKAIERLGIDGDATGALNNFPGTDRRFEQILPNLYSDYGHHPTEIKATIQMARELNDDVVLVYQPHQNMRQYSLVDQYTDCFEGTSEVYWLPTYLTREDKDQPVLTPAELAVNVTNRHALHQAELNDNLWWYIQELRDRGALVLCMGAGSIDEWLREKVKNTDRKT